MKVFLVGGAVRDKLLNRPVKERDWVVVGADPQELLDQGFKPVGKDFPVFLHPQTQEEYALARTERKTAPGYSGFDVYASNDVTLEQDLQRRDLTINAIAEGPEGQLIDPFGGIKDIENRVLKHVSTAFAEDPVRILRIARFSARYHYLGFKVDEDTQDMMRAMVQEGEVDHLVAERVWRETSRALLEPNPEVFIEQLRHCGALERIMPEVDALFGVPQRADYHPEVDCGIHTLMVLQQAVKISPKLSVRFAALVHDLGKALTPPEVLPQHKGHEQRSLPLVNQLCKRMTVPKECRELGLLVAKFHSHCHRAFELRDKTIVKLLRQLDAFRRPQRFEEFLQSCEADARGRKSFEQQSYPQADLLRRALKLCITVSSKDLIAEGFSGPKLGEELRKRQVRSLESLKNS